MSYRAFDGYTSTQTANGVDGYSITLRAQSATGTTTVGGDLILGSGNGTTRDGYVKLFAGDTEQARVAEGRFQFLSGQRLNTFSVTTTPFTIGDGYHVLFVNTSSAKTINLPANPLTGDIFYIKDVSGTANTNNITVQGNGRNIDNAASATINTTYGNLAVIYNGTTWSIL